MHSRVENFPAATLLQSLTEAAKNSRLPEHVAKTLIAISAAFNAGAKAEEPKIETPKPHVVGEEERVFIPRGFLRGNKDQWIEHWLELQGFLEALTIEGEEGRREYTKETVPSASDETIEGIWHKNRDLQRQLFEEHQAIHPQEGQPLPTISYPHAYGSLTVENRENKSTFIVTVKPETTNRVYSIDASWNLVEEQTQLSNIQMHDGGCIRFELKDRNGTIYEGRTGSNGVAILECEGVAFPCVMRFLESTKPTPEVRASTRNSLIEEFGGLVELNDT